MLNHLFATDHARLLLLVLVPPPVVLVTVQVPFVQSRLLTLFLLFLLVYVFYLQVILLLFRLSHIHHLLERVTLLPTRWFLLLARAHHPRFLVLRLQLLLDRLQILLRSPTPLNERRVPLLQEMQLLLQLVILQSHPVHLLLRLPLPLLRPLEIRLILTDPLFQFH